MNIVIRPACVEDALDFLRVHHNAVRGLAASDYPPEILDAWALPITDEAVAEFLSNPDRELRIVAEMEKDIVGIGALVTSTRELRACYIAPQVARRGTGSAIVRNLENLALEHSLDRLWLNSSLTAEPFYRALGYTSLGRCIHTLRTGAVMGCVKMEKRLQPDRGERPT